MSHQALRELEAWFVTGSQHLYGPETLRTVEEHARRIAECLEESADIPVRIVAQRVVTTPDEIARMLAAADASDACIGVVAWMHTFSPAKMWIGGLTNLRKPLVHLHTQFNRDLPWAQIDMDFMNLNQSAHGDREFAFIQSRLGRGRKTIVGHWDDAAVARRLGWWTRAAAGWHESQHLRIARFGDNMREVAVTEGDKVEAQARLGFAVNGYGVNELAAAVGPRARRPSRRARSRSTKPRTTSASRCASAAPATTSCATRHASRWRSAHSSRKAGSARSPTRSRTSASCASCPASPSSGSWPTATASAPRATGRPARWCASSRSWPRACPAARPSWRTTPITWAIRSPRSSARTCSRSVRRSRTATSRARSTRSRSAAVRTRSGSSSTRLPGPAVILGLADLGRRFRLISSTVDIVEPDAPLPSLPVARAVWRPRPDLATAAEAWLTAGGPHHTALTTALPVEPIEDFAEIADIELVSIDAATTVPAFRRELRWNQAYYHLRGGI